MFGSVYHDVSSLLYPYPPPSLFGFFLSLSLSLFFFGEKNKRHQNIEMTTTKSIRCRNDVPHLDAKENNFKHLKGCLYSFCFCVRL